MGPHVHDHGLRPEAPGAGAGAGVVIKEILEASRQKVIAVIRSLDRLHFTQGDYQKVPSTSSGAYIIFDPDTHPCYVGTAGVLRSRIRTHGGLYTTFSLNGNKFPMGSAVRDRLMEVFFRKSDDSREFGSYKEWMAMSDLGELRKVYSDLIADYTFSFIESEEKDRHMLESFLRSAIRPYLGI